MVLKLLHLEQWPAMGFFLQTEMCPIPALAISAEMLEAIRAEPQDSIQPWFPARSMQYRIPPPNKLLPILPLFIISSTNLLRILNCFTLRNLDAAWSLLH